MCIFVFVVPQDAHNCIPEFDEETAMFSVYDGHGGNTRTHAVFYLYCFAECIVEFTAFEH